MRERCSRYSFILDISSLDVLTLNSSSTQVLLVLVLCIRFPRPVLLHSGQDVYSKTVKSSCSPATQGSTITGRCRRFEGR